MKNKYSSYTYGWFIWFLPALFYLFQYGMQALPSVTSNYLSYKLSLSSFELSLLSSSYYYTYIPMQLPVGIIFDRFSARLVLPSALICFALGIFVVAFSHHLILNMVGRMLIGFGGSFAFVGTLYLAGMHLPPSIYPLATGITETFSSLGIIIISIVFTTSAILTTQQWNTLNEFSIGISLLLALIMFISIREKTKVSKLHHANITQYWAALRKALRHPQLWLIALYFSLSFANFVVMANMWRVPALIAIYHLTPIQAIIRNTIVEVGFAVGAVFFGWLGCRLRNYRRQMIIFAALFEFLSLAGTHYLNFPHDLDLKFVLLYILGLSTGASILSFSVARDIVHPSLHGSAAGFVNMACNIVGLLLLPIVGFLLDLTHNNYYVSMTPVIVTTFGAFVITFFIKNPGQHSWNNI